MSTENFCGLFTVTLNEMVWPALTVALVAKPLISPPLMSVDTVYPVHGTSHLVDPGFAFSAGIGLPDATLTAPPGMVTADALPVTETASTPAPSAVASSA